MNPDGGGSTTVSEPLKGAISGTLEKAKSPYRVIGEVLVENGQILAIEAGVEVIFENDPMFIVHGTMLAKGSKNAPVLFHTLEGTWRGIHVHNGSGKSILEFCIIENVSIEYSDSLDHGALDVRNSEIAIRNTIFRNNQTQYGGGIALTNNALAEIQNNIFYANKCVVFGGGIFALESSVEIINNTFYKNYCQNVGGGLVLYHAQSATIQNNIFYMNSGGSGDPRISVSGDTTSLIQQYNFLAEGNNDPKFVFETDLHLRADSPCIDAGNPDPLFNDVDGSRNNQGAYGGPGGEW